MRNRKYAADFKSKNHRYAVDCWNTACKYEDFIVKQAEHLMASIEREWRQYGTLS